jgi:hypothetical protein
MLMASQRPMIAMPTKESHGMGRCVGGALWGGLRGCVAIHSDRLRSQEMVSYCEKH